jgi:hypothetical protein
MTLYAVSAVSEPCCDLSGLQLRAQNLFQGGQENVAIGRGLDGHAGQHALAGDRAQQDQRAPVSRRNRVVDALAAEARNGESSPWSRHFSSRNPSRCGSI